MECTGFLDALNSAPVPGIKIKKKKMGSPAGGAGTSPSAKAVSPTSNKVPVSPLCSLHCPMVGGVISGVEQMVIDLLNTVYSHPFMSLCFSSECKR